MALIDYKIGEFSHDGRHISATIRVYRGSIQNVTEPDWSDLNTIPRPDVSVLRYIRIAKVRERTVVADIPRDMTRAEVRKKVRAYLNKKIVDWATANGHTVIDEEQDITDYEAFINETEV